VSFSVDGDLAFTRYDDPIGRTGVMFNAKAGGNVAVLQNSGTDRNPTISPNGRWMVFESDRSRSL
jgi:Tol biopolymer transport system component